MITGFIGESAPPIVYSTWNSADKDADITLTLGDLLADINNALGSVRGTLDRDMSEHRYFEVKTGNDHHLIGVGKSTATIANFPGSDADGWSYYDQTGEKVTGGVLSAYGSSYATTDVIGVETNNGDIIFWLHPGGVAGSSQGVAFTGLTGMVFPMWGSGSGTGGPANALLNVGASAFVNLPAGASAWE